MTQKSTSNTQLTIGSQSDPITFWQQLHDLMKVSGR